MASGLQTRKSHNQVNITVYSELMLKLSIQIPKAKSNSWQTALNMVSTLVSYVLQFGISFFLTPFIVSKLGTSAYGFIGLSGSIIGYAGLLAVALNSMSGRFITMKYHEGDFDESNRYLASTYYANQAIALFIVIVLGIITVFFEYLINIPSELVADVKFLFALTFINSAISMFCGVYSLGLFIKNRLELGNIRSVIGNILRAVLTVVAYALFPAHLWYIGMIAIICSAYSIITNYLYFKALTPELRVRRSYFRIGYVWEMTKAGAWNLLTSLSSILNQGLDLLLANVFISAYYMGILSLSKSIPWILLSLFASLANTMHPEFIKYYAQKELGLLRNSLVKSIRILGLFTAVPCACLLAYGDIFYSLWLSGQDFNEIYHVSSITMFALLFTMPTQALWYIFTMTNKVKVSSVNMIVYGVINVALVIMAMNLISDDRVKLYAIVSIQAILMIIRFTTFLPVYGAKVLGLPKYVLLTPIFKLVASTVVISIASLVFKYYLLQTYTWLTLMTGCVFTAVIGLSFNYLFTLNSSDRTFIRTRFLRLKQ